MANKKITDLMSGTPARDSLFESAIDISGTMDSRKVIAGAIADLASANVAAAYNSATTYAIGQYCLREGNIYRCIAITTGTFDATKWTQIVVTGEFRRVVELTTAQYEALSSAEQNNGTLYIITDEETTADDIPYSSGVSVADKLDSTDTALSKYYFLNTTATVSGNLTPTDVIKAGAISGGILKAFLQPILVINNSNANVYKAYIRKDNGNICAGENITAGTYEIASILYLA